MSKKKNKFKRSKHSQPQSQVAAPTISNAADLGNPEAKPLVHSSVTNASDSTKFEPDDFYQTNEYAHVRRDIKIVLALLAGIIILLFVIYYIGLKTTYLATFGNWLYKILNIQTL